MSGEFSFEVLTSCDLVLSKLRNLKADQWNACSTGKTFKEVTTEAAYLIDEIQQLMQVSEVMPRCEYRIMDPRGKEIRRRVVRQ